MAGEGVIHGGLGGMLLWFAYARVRPFDINVDDKCGNVAGGAPLRGVLSSLGLRPGPGPGTKHDQHDAYQDEHDAADEQANTDPKRVRDGQIQPSGEGHRGGSVSVHRDHPVGAGSNRPRQGRMSSARLGHPE
jgi:hypothetical protein